MPILPTLAATLMILRDGRNGLQLLMVRREPGSSFVTMRWYSPAALFERDDLSSMITTPFASTIGEREASLRFAAIRETWEETGLLLARNLKGERAKWTDLNAAGGTYSLVSACLAGQVEPAVDELVPFAHWITPPDSRKRFDTYFYLTPFSGELTVNADGTEVTEASWRRLCEVLEAAEAGRQELVLPTRMNLKRLCSSSTVAEAIHYARETPIVTVMPEFEVLEDGRRLVRIPDNAGYGTGVVDATHIPPAGEPV